MASLKTLTEHYKEALQYNKYNEAAAHMGDLTEHVYQLSESLSNTCVSCLAALTMSLARSSVEAKFAKMS